MPWEHMKIIINSEKDQRLFNWLVEAVGNAAIEEACSKLAGNRKPYVSNIVKILGLHPPEHLQITSKEEAHARLTSLKKLIKHRVLKND